MFFSSPHYQFTRWLLLRGLGGICLIAFLSLWVQVEGLVGNNGILPVSDFLSQVSQQLSAPEKYYQLPTLLWFYSSDLMLHLTCAIGTVSSLLLIFNIIPVMSAFLIWVTYLSLAIGGQVFTGYQWDILIIEAAFIALFLAPWKVAPLFTTSPPNLWGIWLMRLLVFKVIFASGVVKLMSGDPVWHNMTALSYHYQTQPLPHFMSWYMHQLPLWWHKFSCALMFLVELGLPFLIFVNRRFRQIAFFGITGLMLLIFMTGNYNFFNLLVIVLALSLLDDTFLKNYFSRFVSLTSQNYRKLSIKKYSTYLFALIFTVVSLLQTIKLFYTSSPVPSLLQQPINWVRPFRTINSYGLFANMTTKRPEIIIQGRYKGQTWKTYSFKWKPNATSDFPDWIQPHQPRLDWQMWFAALKNYRQSRWFVPFLVRLLEGQPEVLDLLDYNPFPNTPPDQIRALTFQYQFTSWEEGQKSGKWWKRTRQGLYCPAFSLDQIRH